MTEKRSITREDVLLRTRLQAEGARYVVKGTPGWDPPPEQGFPAHPVVILDGCNLRATSRPNPRSRIDLIMEGENATISDMGEDFSDTSVAHNFTPLS